MKPAMFGVAVLIAIVGLVGLSFGAANGIHVVGSVDSPQQIHDAQLQDRYFRCLRVEARSLLRPGSVVSVASDSFATVGTILEVVGGWLTIVKPGNPSVPQIALASGSGQHGCHGVNVEERTLQRTGTVRVRIGHGATLPGSGPLPPPIL